MSKNIQVAIKVRPLSPKHQNGSSCWKIYENSIQLIDSQSDPFYFDHIFDEDASNEIIFDKMAKHIVHSALQGINGTIFAYGQTSSGKTYTMMGDDENPGVMVLAAKEIFKQIEKSDRQFLLRVGYIEIYNEKIYDLLNKKNQDLKIHETPTGNVSVNCEECIITCEDQLLNYLCMGNKERTVGETNMNERSSRSHAIFRIIIESRKIDCSEEKSVNQSVLNLVDLAGSERADQTGARGARLKEGGHINKSLLFLSNVIKLLSENCDGDKYISYRDSKLTRILQASIGGNALTSIICTIKLTVVEETQSTLSFAVRAKSIKNKPHVNEVVSEAAMMKRLEREINSLKSQLEKERSKNKSQIKVGQLEQRIKAEVLKIISCNSLNNMKNKHYKRRRTWCPTNSNGASFGLDPLTPALPPLLEPLSEKDTDSDSKPALGLPAPTLHPSLKGAKKYSRKPSKFFTPQLTVRSTPDQFPADLEFPPKETTEEVFEPGETFNFEQPSTSKEADKLDLSPTKGAESRAVSITPKHSVYSNYTDLEAELHKLADFHHKATEEIRDYKKQVEELNEEIRELRIENRDAVSLDIEFQQHKSKSKLREHELLEALEEKCKEINKLQRSLQTLTEEKLHISKDELMKLSRGDSINDNGQICVSCTDLTRLLDENKRLEQNLEALTLDYEKAQLKLTCATEDATLVEIKLASMAHMHNTGVLHCNKVQDEIALVRKEVEKVECGYGSLSSKYDNTPEAYEELNRTVDKERTKMELLQVKYDRLEDVWQKQQQTIDGIQTEYEAIQQKYKKLKAEYETLEHTSESTINDCAQLQARNQCLETEIVELKQRVEKAQNQLAREEGEGGDDAASNGSQVELDEQKLENTKLKMELKQLKYQFDEMQREYDDLSNQLMDQLQDGEELRSQNNKLEAQLASFKTQPTEQQTHKQCTSKEHLQGQIKHLQVEIEQMLSGDGPSSVTSDSSEQRQQQQHHPVNKFGNGVSESMNSSGLGSDDMSTPPTTVGKSQHQLLSQFAELAKAFDEIELEYAAGQKRCFVFDGISQEEQRHSYRLLITDLQGITEHDNDEYVCGGDLHAMQGTFARITFKIVQSNRSDRSEIQSNSSLTAETEDPQQMKAEIKRLTAQNKESQTLLCSMEQVITEMSSKMQKLSEELLEKSLFVEKCACKIYQKQIETLERENAEMSMLCDGLQRTTSGSIKKENLDGEGDGEDTLGGHYSGRRSRSLDNKRAESTATLESLGCSMSVSLGLSWIGEADDNPDLNETLKDDDNNPELCVKLRNIKEDIGYLSQSVANINDQLEAIDSPRTSGDECKRRYEDLEKDFAALKAAHDLQTRDFELLKEQFELQKQEYKVQVDRLQLDLCDKLEIIETEGRDRLRRNREWEDAKSAYNMKIEQLEKQLGAPSDDRQRMEEELRKLRDSHKKFNEIKLAKEKADKELAESKHALEEASKSLMAKSEQVTKLQSLFDEIKKEKTNLAAVKATSIEQLSEIKKLVTEIQQIANNPDKKTNGSAESKSATKREKGQRKADLSSEFQHVKNMLSELRAAANEKQKKSAQNANELKQSRLLKTNRLNEMQTELDKSYSERQRLVAEVHQLDSKNLRHQETIARLELKADKITTQNIDLMQESGAKQAELHREVKTLEQQLAETKLDINKSNDLLLAKTAAAEELQQNLNELQAKHENLLEEKATLEKVHLSCQETLSQRNIELQSLQEAWDKCDESCKQLEQKLESLQGEKSQLLTDYHAVQLAKTEFEQDLDKCVDEKNQMEFAFSQLQQQLENAEKQLKEMLDNEHQRERVIDDLREEVESLQRSNAEQKQLRQDNEDRERHFSEELRKQVKMYNNLFEKHNQLEQSMESLARKHSDVSRQLEREHSARRGSRDCVDAIKRDADHKVEVLHSKIYSLLQELNGMKSAAMNYDNLCANYNKLVQEVGLANEEKEARVRYIHLLEKELHASKIEIEQAQRRRAHVKERLLVIRSSTHAALEVERNLCVQVQEQQEQMSEDYAQLLREKCEIESQMADVRLSCRIIQEQNELLERDALTAREALAAAEAKLAKSESYRKELESVKVEKLKLQEQLRLAIEEASESVKLHKEVERYKKKLQAMEALEKLCALKEAAEANYNAEKMQLEATVDCLLSAKKTLEERLHATEVLLKKSEEKSAKAVVGDSANNADRDMNAAASVSPHNRRMHEQATAETIRVQRKTSHNESAERKNRRLSSHDERRRHSGWDFVADASTMTDPADSKCKCVELDARLRVCEHDLFIRESQVTALTLELKSHPLRTENNNLIKRLQEEQEKCAHEIARYRQKARVAKAMLAAARDEYESATAAAAAAAAAPQKSEAHIQTQTESDWESSMQKLYNKYTDLKNICRFRHTTIKNLQEQIDEMNKENGSGNKGAAVVETAQIKALQQECAALNKELSIYKQKYEDARNVLQSRHSEIQYLRAQLDTNRMRK